MTVNHRTINTKTELRHDATRISRRTWLGLWACELAAGKVAAANPVTFQVIVHPSAEVDGLSLRFIADAFLKKRTLWPNGLTIHPVDLRPSSEVRAQFSEVVLRRPVAAVRSYWQQNIFSGRDLPPPELESDAAVLTYVQTHEGAIGYLSGGTPLQGVRKVELR